MSGARSRGRSLSEAAAAVGVILGLVFVVVEIRANTAVSRAEARREASAQNVEFLMQVAMDPDLNRIWMETWTDEYVDGLSEEDQYRVFLSAIAVTLRLETVYLQYKEGVLDSAALGSYGMYQPKLRQPWFRRFWTEEYRPLLDAEFVDYFETVNGYGQ